MTLSREFSGFQISDSPTALLLLLCNNCVMRRDVYIDFSELNFLNGRTELNFVPTMHWVSARSHGPHGLDDWITKVTSGSRLLLNLPSRVIAGFYWYIVTKTSGVFSLDWEKGCGCYTHKWGNLDLSTDRYGKNMSVSEHAKLRSLRMHYTSVFRGAGEFPKSFVWVTRTDNAIIINNRSYSLVTLQQTVASIKQKVTLYGLKCEFRHKNVDGSGLVKTLTGILFLPEPLQKQLQLFPVNTRAC